MRDRHQGFLAVLPDDEARWRPVCELNVIEQVRNVAPTTVVGDDRNRQQSQLLHGWIHGLADGRLQDLQAPVKEGAEPEAAVAQAAAVRARHGATRGTT